jgi:6-phosphogluconate dehydrogenase
MIKAGAVFDQDSESIKNFLKSNYIFIDHLNYF